jgi:hypothetical protein
MDKIINLLFFSVILCGIAGLYLKNDGKQHENKILNDVVLKQYLEDINKKKYIVHRDENALYNELAPPERRVPEYQYPWNSVKSQLNIPTRGYPESYHQIGIATSDDEKAFNLFGRQTYPGSNQYEYYVVGKMGYQEVKIPVGVKGKKEIMDNDMIKIHGNKGDFRVKMYDYDVPRYVPIL